MKREYGGNRQEGETGWNQEIGVKVILSHDFEDISMRRVLFLDLPPKM